MSHFDSYQLNFIWLPHITLNYWQPTDSPAGESVTYYFSLYVGAKRLVFHLSLRDDYVMVVSGCLILTANLLLE